MVLHSTFRSTLVENACQTLYNTHMETQTRIGAKEFFLQIGAMVALYAGAIALLNLLFTVINYAFPQVDQYRGYSYYYSNPISFPVATLIIVFPLFLFLSWVIQKSYETNPSLRENALRKWLVYITLFIAGIAVVGDLITLIYQFLDGQELTIGFLLKVLSVLVVAGGVFSYYLSDLKNKLTVRSGNLWRIFAAVLVVGAIVVGFAVIGSPATQRALRYDSQRVSDLENIQWQAVNFWQQKGSLPQSASNLGDSLSGWIAPLDPRTKQSYEYERIGNLSFKLCTTFERATPKMPSGYPITRPIMDSKPAGLIGNNNWEHEAGYVCFERTIDPDLYPPREKLR